MQLKYSMKITVLFVSVLLTSGLLFVNIYNSIVDAVSWGSDIPSSLEIARQYFKSTNPGHFFRVFSPLNQILILVSLILFWKQGTIIRLLLLFALLIHIGTDVLTFLYFYPRNDIMFFNQTMPELSSLKQAWSEWSNMNHFRSFLVFCTLILSSWSLYIVSKYSLRAGIK